jgi:hypothetical protein
VKQFLLLEWTARRCESGSIAQIAIAVVMPPYQDHTVEFAWRIYTLCIYLEAIPVGNESLPALAMHRHQLPIPYWDSFYKFVFGHWCTSTL